MMAKRDVRFESCVRCALRWRCEPNTLHIRTHEKRHIRTDTGTQAHVKKEDEIPTRTRETEHHTAENVRTQHTRA